MNKHFYFPLYTKEFIAGTVQMTAEELGAYIRLLCWQFDNGSVPISDATAIKNITGVALKKLSRVIDKFPQGENNKLRYIKEKGEILSNIRKQIGSKGGSKTQAKLKQNSSKYDDSNIYSYIESDSESKLELKSRMSRPTLQEVESYVLEAGLSINPEQFFNYYSANGWRVGRNPMKDWKAAARHWQSREKSYPQKKTKTQETHERALAFENKIMELERGNTNI